MTSRGQRSASQQRHFEEARRITLIGLVGNVALSALKFVIGTASSSQALVADAVHSLSDTGTDVAILLGVRYWSAPADDCHPYGHWRIESLVTVAIAAVLAAAAVGLGINALGALHDPRDTPPGAGALAVALASIAVKEILFRGTLKVGRRIHSTAVVANAWHHRSDALSSVTVAGAVLVALIRPDWSYVDSIGAIVVGLFILHAAWLIVRGALRDLIDSGASSSQRDRIRELARAIGGVDDVHAIRTRRLGPGLFVDLHVTVDGALTVRSGHDISEAVKKKLIAEGPEILDVVIHLEPAGVAPERNDPNSSPE